MQLLAPTSEQISAIQQFREKNRASTFFNHLSAISESIPALGWVAVAPTPAPYVKEMNDAGQFYSNRVLKDWKEKDKKHGEWCRAWVQLLSGLQAYVKQYHTTGLVWSGKLLIINFICYNNSSVLDLYWNSLHWYSHENRIWTILIFFIPLQSILKYS